MGGDKRSALVTGGTRGIGRAVTKKLAGSGIDVAAAFVNDYSAAQQVTDDCQGAGTTITVHRADVGDQDSCRRLIDEVLEAHGRLDYLVTTPARSSSSVTLTSRRRTGSATWRSTCRRRSSSPRRPSPRWSSVGLVASSTSDPSLQ